MNKNILLGLLAAVLIIGGFFIATSLGGNSDSSVASNTSSDESVEDNSASEAEEARITEEKSVENADVTLTTAEVAKRSTQEDCWTIVDGAVYDITLYIPRHPGGDEILRACGTDGTSLFKDRTTEDGESVGSGRPHSESAQSQLEDFKLGTLES